MKYLLKILAVVFLICSMYTLVSCSNAHIASSAGVDVVWGSHGPRVVPSMSIGVYGGGRR
ncbi:hypothetical protein HX109_02360 [Galbibacter sp. BG1]|uniref:hypothetical protein n=1 Tax=Galbibacter sp. BG1 TaxID=1170699 RepID=UPI0015B93BAB|nr:hypothetical protein [Galbibacter sp. BG1]QLE00458.1 hypothetical protein HX109_02360 [Galbibacter sp. BG1]